MWTENQKKTGGGKKKGKTSPLKKWLETVTRQRFGGEKGRSSIIPQGKKREGKGGQKGER